MAEARVGVIGGSGLGEALADTQGEAVHLETPFGEPSDKIVLTNLGGTDTAILSRHGPGHVRNPSQVNYRANIYAMKALGCTHIISSGAVGSLRENIRPKELVVPEQVIDKTFRRAATFFDEHFAAHVEMAMLFCPVLRGHLLACADAVEAKVHDGGTYICMEGPSFSTRAESEMHRAWGGDLIGMTCMPEARLAREAEIAYAVVCLCSDYDCWRPAAGDLDKHELLKEIIANLSEATQNALELIKAALKRFAEIAETPSPARGALELAIWSNKEMISPQARQQLAPLMEKYL